MVRVCNGEVGLLEKVDNTVQDPLLMTRADIDALTDQPVGDVRTAASTAMQSMVTNLTTGANTVDAKLHRIFLFRNINPYYNSLLDEQNRRDISAAKPATAQQQRNNTSRGRGQAHNPAPSNNQHNHVLSVNKVPNNPEDNAGLQTNRAVLIKKPTSPVKCGLPHHLVPVLRVEKTPLSPVPETQEPVS